MRIRVPSGPLVLAFLCALWAPACNEGREVSARARPIEPEHDGFWWTNLGQQSSAVVNFGPSVELAGSLHRQWCLVIHLPGTPEPLTCLQGLVAFDDQAPIAARGAYFAIELRPLEHHLWGDVRSKEQLAVSVEGLY